VTFPSPASKTFSVGWVLTFILVFSIINLVFGLVLKALLKSEIIGLCFFIKCPNILFAMLLFLYLLSFICFLLVKINLSVGKCNFGYGCQLFVIVRNSFVNAKKLIAKAKFLFVIVRKPIAKGVYTELCQIKFVKIFRVKIHFFIILVL
jgi:hypothetical protein